MGRPTVMTPEVIAKLEEAFAWGCSDREACLWAGIAEPTLYLYQEKHPEFIDRKAALKDTVILKSRKTVANAVERGDRDTAKWILERKKKDEFSTKVENDTTLSGGATPVLVEFVNGNVNETNNTDTNRI